MNDAPTHRDDDALLFFRSRFGLDDQSLTGVLDTALERRVDYADLFFEYTTQDSVSLEEGIVKSGDRHVEQGVGVRAQIGERQGYAHSDEVTIESLRLAAAGNMIDFRYRIVDPAKARMLVDRTITPYLIEQSSGKTVEVPKSTKIGPLRQTTKYGDPPADRVFFVLFGNPGGLVQPGSRVTVVVGDFRAEDLIVE